MEINLIKSAVAGFAPHYYNAGTDIAPDWVNMSAHILQWKVDAKADEIDASTWDSSNYKSQAGRLTFTVTTTIAYRQTDTVVGLFGAAFLNRSSIGLKFPFGTQTVEAGFTISGFSQNGSQGELAKYDVTLAMSTTPNIY